LLECLASLPLVGSPLSGAAANQGNFQGPARIFHIGDFWANFSKILKKYIKMREKRFYWA